MQLKDIINHISDKEIEPTVQVWSHQQYGSVVARIRFVADRSPDVVFDSYNTSGLRVDEDNATLAAGLKALGVPGTTFDLDW